MNNSNGDVSITVGGSIHIIESASVGETIVVKERSFGVDSISSDGSLAAKCKRRRLHQTESIELVLGEQSGGELHGESGNAWRRGEGRDEGME